MAHERSFIFLHFRLIVFKVIVGTKTDLRDDKRTIQNVAKQRKRIITPPQVNFENKVMYAKCLCRLYIFLG